MKFKIQREAFIKPLEQISGSVGTNQKEPITQNVLMKIEYNDPSGPIKDTEYKMYLICTDTEIELVSEVGLYGPVEKGAITVEAKKLATIVFNDPEQLETLDDIVHPLVENYIQSKMVTSRKEGKRIFVVESAILIEVGYKQFCDEVWFVKAPESTRIKRLREARNMTQKQALAVMNRQMSDAEYEKNCDYTIKNNADLKTLFKRIEKRLRQLHLLED